MLKRVCCLVLLFHFSFQYLYSQDTLSFFTPSTTYNSHRATGVGITSSVLYVGSMSGLYTLWYQDYPLEKFHFFDDHREWFQVDKVGHITTAYYIGKLGIDVIKWTGMEHKKAAWYGGSIAFLFQTSIEVFDGFSPGWGFSISDFAANTIGTAAVVSQELLWKEQRIVLKFSFHQSSYAKYRPSLLGDKFSENILKDYNGQTYWTSININSFIKNSWIPKWLNIAVGYGAEGMIGANDNIIKQDNTLQDLSYINRYRQYYLALDLDLTKVKTDQKWLKTIFKTFGFLKIPLPTLEYNKEEKFKFYPIYF